MSSFAFVSQQEEFVNTLKTFRKASRSSPKAKHLKGFHSFLESVPFGYEIKQSKLTYICIHIERETVFTVVYSAILSDWVAANLGRFL